jgi:DNA-binding transcriptional ArsR family regulator
MEVVRAILMAIEDEDQPWLADHPEVAGAEPFVVSSHIKLLRDAGLIEAVDVQTIDNPYPAFIRISLTWSGHEFLDTVRDPEVWRRTKEGAGKVGSWSISILADLAKGYSLAKARELGLPV